jgi:hypothetical protein
MGSELVIQDNEALNDADRAALEHAAGLLLAQRASVLRPAAWIGRRVHRAGRILSQINAAFAGPGDSRRSRLLEAALRSAYTAGTFRLDPAAVTRPSRHRLGRLLAAASGSAGGFAGVAGIAADLPVTTAMIMRAIAATARAHGEDIGSEDTRRACLEVFALGSPESGEQDVEMAYWATRAAFNHTSINLAISQVAQRLGVVLAQKYLAQAVPLVGAATGGALNYLFMQHYQRMAEVHFTIRELERRRDPAAVRAYFDNVVEQKKAAV